MTRGGGEQSQTDEVRRWRLRGRYDLNAIGATEAGQFPTRCSRYFLLRPLFRSRSIFSRIRARIAFVVSGSGSIRIT